LEFLLGGSMGRVSPEKLAEKWKEKGRPGWMWGDVDEEAGNLSVTQVPVSMKSVYCRHVKRVVHT
jgi:hypothetical protein